MKKILLGLLIVAALSGCSSTTPQEEMEAKIQTLNTTIEKNSETLAEVQSETEQIRAELLDTALTVEYEKMVKAFEGTGVTVTRTEKGLHLLLPTDTSFPLNKATPNDEIKVVLDAMASTLTNYPETEAKIKGHTDTTGSDSFNQTLSEKRAKAVEDCLVGRGVEEERIETVGVGSSEPTYTNETREGRQSNRMVDIVIEYD